MIRLFDERDGNFEILGMAAVKEYLGACFEDCKDEMEIDEKLQAINNGDAGYRCEYVNNDDDEIKIGEVYTFGDIWDGSGDFSEILEDGTVSPDNDIVIAFDVIAEDGILSQVRVTDIY